MNKKIIDLVNKQISTSSKICNINVNVSKILSSPQNKIAIQFPVKLSNNEFKIFSGYRIQHNNIMGPYKGGLRFHPDVSLDEATALATLQQSGEIAWLVGEVVEGDQTISFS